MSSPESNLGQVLHAVSRAAVDIAGQLHSGLSQENGVTNSSGDPQLVIDHHADFILARCLEQTGLVACIASEEKEEVVTLRCGDGAQFSVAYDPLDGSKHVAPNFSTGTIFSIFPGDELVERPGSDIVASGYVLYGSRTVLVVSWGDGVNEYELSEGGSRPRLVRENIRLESTFNLVMPGNFRHGAVNPRYAELIAQWGTQAKTLRYDGALVADVHRMMSEQGGVYAYPTDPDDSNQGLRLLYEAAPMAWLVEQAGGISTDGERPILSLTSEDLHARTSLFLGSPEGVTACTDFLFGSRGGSR